MKLNKFVVPLLAIVMLLLAFQPPVHAQDKEDAKTEDVKTEDKKDTKAQSGEALPRRTMAYRFDLAVNELIDGKKINTRHYSMNTTSDSTPESLRVQTRVPTQTEEGKFTYLDVGTQIDLRIMRWTTPITVVLYATVTSFATPEEAGRQHPLLREVHIQGTIPLIADKPIVVGTVDDPSSNRQFQLEVTITVIK